MFERFTREARSVVKIAVAAATDLGHQRVDTVHLLLGISAQGDPASLALAAVGIDEPGLRAQLAQARVLSAGGDVLDTEALSTIGIDYDAVRQAAEQRFGPGALAATTSPPDRRRWLGREHIPFAGESRRALVRSLVVAKQLSERELRPSHVLLSILDDPFCTASRLLDRRGVWASAIQDALRASPS